MQSSSVHADNDNTSMKQIGQPFISGGRCLTRLGYGSALFRFLSSNNASYCPFQVLKIPKSSSYADVKKAFVKLALEHHPDTAHDKSLSHETFASIRQAFESIRNDNGRATTADGVDNNNHTEWTDESLDSWFYQETGQHLSFHMDSSTRQEVKEVAETMSRGGLDTGGLWDLANMIARQERNKTAGEDPLQVTCGTKDKTANASDTGRRRRRRT